MRRLSLKIMKESFKLHPLVTVLRQFGFMECHYLRSTELVLPVSVECVHEALSSAIPVLEKLELNTSKNAAIDFKLAIERGNIFIGTEFAERCKMCFKTIQCEAEHVLCERVDGRPAPSLQYEQDSLTRLPASVAELDEAEWCLTYERWTASVFHSMRAVEVILKAVWTTLKIPPPKKAESWGTLIGHLDIELATPIQHAGAKPLPAKNSLWQANLGFFSEIVADLRAIKRAYRDTTMHVESVYTEKDARAIHAATLSLVRDVARHLDQDGNWF